MSELFYRWLKRYCQAALWFYFKRWQVNHAHRIPAGPVILVANHQNAFLDAVLISCSISRPVWSLARAEVFQKPWAQKILTVLKMMPVFRFRDGFSTLKKNDQTFDACVKLLSRGEAILIFAEGNHHDHWRLRPLQKGFARIALSAEEKNNWTLGVKIVPIGIQYEQPNDSLSRVLMNVGNPILVKDIIDTNDSNATQLNDLVTFTTGALEPLILHIEEEHYLQRVNYLMRYRVRTRDLAEQLAMDNAVLQSFTPEEDVPTKRKPGRFWNPIYTYWFLNSMLPWLIIQVVFKLKMKDPQFTASLKFALGMVLVPLFLILQTLLFSSFAPTWMATLYLISVPLAFKLQSRLI